MLQDGTEASDKIFAAAAVDDGSVIISGYTEGSYGAVNSGSTDFVAVEVDSDGSLVWKWQVRILL